MRKLIKCTGCLVLLFTFLLSFQIKAQENQISVYSYVYVEPDQMGEFMNRMETYWYNVAESATGDNLQFFALLTKMDGFDIPNSSNVLIITGYKNLDKMQETWNPEGLFPNTPMEKMSIWNVSTLKHRLYVRSKHWVEKEGVNPDTDFQYISMSYHDTDSPDELVALENEHWGTFLKDAMEKGQTTQKGWGNAVIVAPTNPNMGAKTISFELWPSLNDFMGSWFTDEAQVPEDGLAKIMELEKGPRMQYVYKIQHVVQAPQPN